MKDTDLNQQITMNKDHLRKNWWWSIKTPKNKSLHSRSILNHYKVNDNFNESSFGINYWLDRVQQSCMAYCLTLLTHRWVWPGVVVHNK